MDLIRKIARRSLIILLPAALAASFIEWWRLPAGVLAGGMIALANIKGLAWGIDGLLGSEKATGRMLFFSQFRFMMVIIVLSFLIFFRLVNIFGLLAGFTVVFAVVIFEGYRNSKDADSLVGQINKRGG